MKNTLLAASISCVLVAPVAHAQDSVTLYGIIDSGIAYVNSVASGPHAVGKSRTSAATGFGSGDRWGVTGTENLGNGLSAIFTLENGFSGTTGAFTTGGRMFGRQAFVGLSDRRYGSLTLGRQYDYTFDYVAPLLSWMQFGSIYGAHVGDADNSFQTFRLNNSVKYQVSPLPGLQLGGLYAFSNQASGPNGQGFANNRAWALGARYNDGPLRFASSFLLVNNPSAGLPASTNPGGAIGDEYSGSSNLFYNVSFVTRQQVFAVGSGYSWDALSFNFAYSDSRLDYAIGRDIRIDNYELNGKYQITPAFLVGLAYIFTDGSGYTGTGANAYANGTEPRWHQLNFGAAYFLSKHTDVHFSAVYQRAAGDATTAALNMIGPAGQGVKSQLLLALGLRHRF
jgi:GBP family porin